MVRKTAVAPQGVNGRGAAALTLLPSLGHGLLTPLTVLKGDIQLMRRRVRRDASRLLDVRALDRMSTQVDRLNFEIGIVLDATHLLARGLDLHPVPTELIGLVYQVLASLQPESMLMTAALVDQPETPVVGVWDEVRIKRVLYVLVANALKFGGGGIGRRRARVSANHVRVEVEDCGIGVPEDVAGAIFDPGYRAENARSLPGAGLGLYVARGIVTQHGGTVGVLARPGGGSVFWFTLPLDATDGGR